MVTPFEVRNILLPILIFKKLRYIIIIIIVIILIIVIIMIE